MLTYNIIEIFYFKAKFVLVYIKSTVINSKNTYVYYFIFKEKQLDL